MRSNAHWWASQQLPEVHSATSNSKGGGHSNVRAAGYTLQAMLDESTIKATATPWWSDDSKFVLSAQSAYSAQTVNFGLEPGATVFEIDCTAPIEVSLVNAVSEASIAIFSGGPDVGIEVFTDVAAGTYSLVVIMEGEGTWAIFIWQ